MSSSTDSPLALARGQGAGALDGTLVRWAWAYIITVALGQLEATDLFVAVISRCLVAAGLIELATRLERRLLHWRPEHVGRGDVV